MKNRAIELQLTPKRARALVNCLDMVLSIQGSIQKGDPDWPALIWIEQQTRDMLAAWGEAEQEGIGQMTARKKLTRKRRSAIIAELCRLSRNGWANAKPCDYQPLERELANDTDAI